MNKWPTLYHVFYCHFLTHITHTHTHTHMCIYIYIYVCSTFGIKLGTKPQTKTLCTSWCKQKWKSEKFQRLSVGRTWCLNVYRNWSFCPILCLPVLFVRCDSSRPFHFYLFLFPADFQFAVGQWAAIFHVVKKRFEYRLGYSRSWLSLYFSRLCRWLL